MSERAIECRIMQYTETHGIYLVINHSGKRFLTKDPRAIHTEKDSSESENEDEPIRLSESPTPTEPPPAPRKSKRIEENLELGRGIPN